MPTHRPERLDRRGSVRSKPWHARQKRDGIDYSLGYYATREEAVQAEMNFRQNFPPIQRHTGEHQRLETA